MYTIKSYCKPLWRQSGSTGESKESKETYHCTQPFLLVDLCDGKELLQVRLKKVINERNSRLLIVRHPFSVLLTSINKWRGIQVIVNSVNREKETRLIIKIPHAYTPSQPGGTWRNQPQFLKPVIPPSRVAGVWAAWRRGWQACERVGWGQGRTEPLPALSEAHPPMTVSAGLK